MFQLNVYIFLPKRVKKRMMRGALCIHRELELNNKKKCINPFTSPSVKYELIKIYIFYVCACFKLNFHVINIINLHISFWAFLPSLCSNFSNSAKKVKQNWYMMCRFSLHVQVALRVGSCFCAVYISFYYFLCVITWLIPLECAKNEKRPSLQKVDKMKEKIVFNNLLLCRKSSILYLHILGRYKTMFAKYFSACSTGNATSCYFTRLYSFIYHLIH